MYRQYIVKEARPFKTKKNKSLNRDRTSRMKTFVQEIHVPGMGGGGAQRGPFYNRVSALGIKLQLSGHNTHTGIYRGEKA